MNAETKELILHELDNAIERYPDYPIDDVVYFDLNPIYKDSDLKRKLTNLCVDAIESIRVGIDPLMADIDYIACIESRGFIMGSILSNLYSKGILLLRSKPGRLPGKTSKVKHKLEYGTATMEVQKGKGKILIYDDVVATGGTANAATKVLKKGGYDPVYSLFLLELSYCKPKLKTNHESILIYNEKPSS